MFEVEKRKLEEEILAFCESQGLPAPETISWNQIPFSGEWGLSTSFFQIAADEARSGKKVVVPKRAAELAEAAAQHLGTPAGFARVEAVKGYLNLYFSAPEFATRVVGSALKQAADFGRGQDTGQQIMVEFSQPNTHKAFHVGHLRNMIFGDALANILEFAGNRVIRANYIGDIGLHVMKWIWNYLNNHKDEKPPRGNQTGWVGKLYTEAVRLIDQNPDLEAEVQDLFARWERGDHTIKATWEETRGWSLESFNQVYNTLGIRFDRIYYESEFENSGKEIVEELITRGIAVDERPTGPVFVRVDDLLGLRKEKYRVLVILRSDSTSLYSTKDLALALRKFDDYNLDLSLYIVDIRQSLHFEQVFKTLEIGGYKQAQNCMHIAYQIVNLPGNVTMSSREGTMVLLERLINEAVERAMEIVRGNRPLLSQEAKEAIARIVGLGAIKFPMLARDNYKTLAFDWKSALDFNGYSSPYIQYACVRATSILKQAPDWRTYSADYKYRLAPIEIELINLISQLPEIIQRSASEFKTLPLADLAYDVAKAFNEFYNSCPVLKAPKQVRKSRLHLVAASRQVIWNCLDVLGIEVPESM